MTTPWLHHLLAYQQPALAPAGTVPVNYAVGFGRGHVFLACNGVIPPEAAEKIAQALLRAAKLARVPAGVN